MMCLKTRPHMDSTRMHGWLTDCSCIFVLQRLCHNPTVNFVELGLPTNHAPWETLLTHHPFAHFEDLCISRTWWMTMNWTLLYVGAAARGWNVIVVLQQTCFFSVPHLDFHVCSGTACGTWSYRYLSGRSFAERADVQHRVQVLYTHVLILPYGTIVL